jgi:hypothetical protein
LGAATGAGAAVGAGAATGAEETTPLASTSSTTTSYTLPFTVILYLFILILPFLFYYLFLKDTTRNFTPTDSLSAIVIAAVIAATISSSAEDETAVTTGATISALGVTAFGFDFLLKTQLNIKSATRITIKTKKTVSTPIASIMPPYVSLSIKLVRGFEMSTSSKASNKFVFIF